MACWIRDADLQDGNEMDFFGFAECVLPTQNGRGGFPIAASQPNLSFPN